MRISKYREIFDKSYKGNWSEELFIINKIQPTVPITYKIKDLLGEDIKGSFYRQELQKADQEYLELKRYSRKITRIKECLLSGRDIQINSTVGSHYSCVLALRAKGPNHYSCDKKYI